MTAIALVTSLVIYWVFDVGAFEREETLRNKLIAAAGIGVVVLAHRCLSPYFFRGTLKAGRPASPSARLMVNLIAAPRPKVLIDGKVAGAVADVLRVRPGERHVRVRGWVDHSDEIAIYAAAGQLVELEASRTSSGSLAAVATGASIHSGHLLHVLLRSRLDAAAAHRRRRRLAGHVVPVQQTGADHDVGFQINVTIGSA